MEDDLNGRWPQWRQPQWIQIQWKKILIEDNFKRGRPQWKKTSIEDDLNRRQPHLCKTAPMEDNLNERWPWWKTTSIEKLMTLLAKLVFIFYQKRFFDYIYKIRIVCYPILQIKYVEDCGNCILNTLSYAFQISHFKTSVRTGGMACQGSYMYFGFSETIV